MYEDNSLFELYGRTTWEKTIRPHDTKAGVLDTWE